MQWPTRRLKRIRPPPTNSKNILKSFCEVGYTNFRPNVFSADKRISVEILGGVGLHALMPIFIKKIRSFFKKRKCARKVFIVLVMLSDLNKTSNRAVTHTYKMDENWSGLLSALIKPNWCVLLYFCACLPPNTILMETGWTTVPCPATNLSILICKSSAWTK